MDVIEVDPKLFVTCRLCLEDLGQYQIVPSIQQQIKYCFDIDVESFDGLPQLICMKCKETLTKFYILKNTLCEKQAKLRSNISKKDINAASVQPQQDAVSSSQQISDTTGSNRPKSRIKRRIVSSESENSCNVTNIVTTKRKKKSTKKRPQWNAEGYTKRYVCTVCRSKWTNIKSFNSHFRVHAQLRSKYPSIFNKHMSVTMKKVDDKPNLTGLNEIVVLNSRKIIESINSLYYVSYSKGNDSPSTSVTNSPLNYQDPQTTDSEPDILAKPKHCRRRAISQSSNDTVVLDSNKLVSDEKVEEKLSKQECKEPQSVPISNDQCINIEDSSDSETERSQIESQQRAKQPVEASLSDYKIIQGIITACVKSYHKKIDPVQNKDKQIESHLKHKVLSIGRKIINNKSQFAWTGFLKYLEHKNIGIEWVTKTLYSNNSNKEQNFIRILTKLRETETVESDGGWLPVSDPEVAPPLKVTPPPKVAQAQKIAPALKVFKLAPKVVEAASKVVEPAPKVVEPASKVVEPAPKVVEPGPMVADDVSVTSFTPADELQLQTIAHNINNSSSSAIYFICPPPDSKSKLLNANPVANPKQLPKKLGQTCGNKTVTDTNALFQNVEDNGLLPMPIITSTKSLAPSLIEKENNTERTEALSMPIITSTQSLTQKGFEQTNVPVTNFTVTTSTPRIKVKPVSELMSERMLNSLRNEQSKSITQQNDNMNSMLINQIGNTNNLVLSPIDNTNNIAISQSTWTQPNNMSMPYIPSLLLPLTCIANVQPGSTMQAVITSPPATSEGYFVMDTVELPNTKTKSPFKYAKDLLRIYGLLLFDHNETLHRDFVCLIKFKVQFRQPPIDTPVLLCLSLLCYQNTFCVIIKDSNNRNVNASKIPTNWQWEILKLYTGNLVNQLLQNAQKHSQETYTFANKFICLLKSIHMSKPT